jgi:hypothetical protein
MELKKMDWTDTLILETAPGGPKRESSVATDFTRVIALQGITLLCANTTSRDETASALELLRGFRATGRRVVLCDTTQLVVGKQFGCEVVEGGAANLLVSCGISGREVGIGARDAGLDLASVLVCNKPLAGGQALACQLVPGDTVLLLGMDNETCDEVAKLIDSQLCVRTAVAA